MGKNCPLSSCENYILLNTAVMSSIKSNYLYCIFITTNAFQGVQLLDGVFVNGEQITKRRASRHSKWLQRWMCRSQDFGSRVLGSWVHLYSTFLTTNAFQGVQSHALKGSIEMH
jgi:hypothetical protein